MRRTVEGGCPSFEFLDPALRPRRFDSANGEKKRRIRVRASVHLLEANVDFIDNIVLPSDAKMFAGRFTRALHRIVDVWLNELDGAIPEVPPRETDEFVSCEKCMSLLPASMEGLNRIVAYWRETDRRVTRSEVVDYFISLSRKRHENLKRGA